MPTPISPEALPAFGVLLNHERMDNGQLRFRLTGADNSSYIRCENRGGPAWENAHLHSALQELVLVQRGRVIFVELTGQTPVFRLLCQGDFVTTTPGVAHTEWLDRDTTVHTIKFGDCASPDWISSPQLDALTHPLSGEEALALAGGSP